MRNVIFLHEYVREDKRFATSIEIIKFHYYTGILPLEKDPKAIIIIILMSKFNVVDKYKYRSQRARKF